jgi:ribosomal protein L11 methyltransferase
MSWRATLPCTRVQAEALPDAGELFPIGDIPPVLVADEPDPASPDSWLLHAYFDHEPTAEELAVLFRLGSGPANIEQLGEDDWVRMSQSGLEPIRASRFFVHTPTHQPDPNAISFEIDASLAFGTGQHATTSGCLEALDRLERDGQVFINIADIGTGTGLLAFAALALWPDARCIATDLDSVAIDVARDNAAINHVPIGHSAGELLLAVADGMDSAMLAARAPFDLIIANILAGPLIELAPGFEAALAADGTVILAGLLDTQADAVVRAYQERGISLAHRGAGEWPVLVLTKARAGQA